MNAMIGRVAEAIAFQISCPKTAMTPEETFAMAARAAIEAMQDLPDNAIIGHVGALEHVLYAERRGMFAAVRAGHKAMIAEVLK